MSEAEMQIEEESLQLTPEDIQLLSKYSWDMTGYTSRFGFFYLGNENADVEGLTKWQAEHIFQLTPIPPDMEDALQDIEKTKRIDKEKKKEIQKQNEAIADAYLLRALQEKNLLFLSFFLHGYEHRLNGKVYSFIRRNGLDPYDPVLFLDMKLALQELILKKLADATKTSVTEMVDIVGRANAVSKVEEVVDGCEYIVLGYMLGSKKMHLFLNRLLDEVHAVVTLKALRVCLGDDRLELLVAYLLSELNATVRKIVSENKLGADGVVAEDLDDLLVLLLVSYELCHYPFTSLTQMFEPRL